MTDLRRRMQVGLFWKSHILEQANDAQGKTTVQRSQMELVFMCMVLVASAFSCAAQQAAVSGVVRDAGGVAQLGVLVQITAADASIVGRAFTDLRGHYLVGNITPGQYQVRATAAMFAPAMRANLRLHSGAKAVVNLTMSTVFDTTTWLPVERRKADEPSDDWKWTLRSTANRPILRILDDDGQLVMVSSSATETLTPSLRGRAGLSSGDGGFGGGGIHNVITIDRVLDDGAGVVLRTDTGTGRTQFGVGPSTEISAGYEQRTGFAGSARTVVSAQSHPEMVSTGNVNGMQTMEAASAQRTKLGDTVELEVGTAVYAVHTDGYAMLAQPFLRVVVEPVPGWMFGYRMATSREIQGFSGLNAVQPEIPVAVVSNGRLRTEQGRHQELSLGRKVGRGHVQMSLYRDVLNRVAIGGSGLLTPVDINVGAGVNGIMTDPSTGSFRLLATGYTAQGVNLMMTQPLSQNLWAAFECSTGSGLMNGSQGSTALATVVGGLQERSAKSATVALRGTLDRTGTKIRAAYRWQPNGLVTPVDAYREFSDQAFLSFRILQPIRWEGVLPSGLEASVDVTNLLSQGYQPFVSSDGRTLFLAQAPRALQAGLSINF